MRKSLILPAICLILLTSCFIESRDEQSSDPGFVSMEINLKPSSNALLKIASADTFFTLDTLKIILSAPFISPTTYTYVINGRSDTGSIAVSTKTYALASLRTWTAQIVVLDTGLNPTRTDTVYKDSVSFLIRPGDTAFVNKTASPAFSILRARLVSNSPGSLTNPVKWIRLRVDGTTRDSMPVGPKLKAISFGNGTTGSVVGDSGTILRTTNSGANWSTNTSGTSRNLNSVSFTSATAGFAVGDSGTALKTTDGVTWALQSTGTTQNLNGLHFRTSSSGFAVGNAGTIKISSGTSWSNPTTNPATQNLNAVFFPSNSVGYAVGNSGTILKTSNTGVTWAALTNGATRNLNAVYFTSTTAGFAVGDSGTILKTTDGSTWAILTSGTTKKLNGVYFTATNTGYAVGDSGTLLKTTDGTSWTPTVLTSAQNLNAIRWTTNNNTGALVGNVGTMITGTNGTTWSHALVGTKSFDMLLTYKYLTPNISHTVLMDAMDTLSTPMRGYQATKTISISAGKDTTITPTTGLSKCGYSGFSNCL